MELLSFKHSSIDIYELKDNDEYYGSYKSFKILIQFFSSIELILYWNKNFNNFNKAFKMLKTTEIIIVTIISAILGIILVIIAFYKLSSYRESEKVIKLSENRNISSPIPLPTREINKMPSLSATRAQSFRLRARESSFRGVGSAVSPCPIPNTPNPFIEEDTDPETARGSDPSSTRFLDVGLKSVDRRPSNLI